jgi:hypothetical protein
MLLPSAPVAIEPGTGAADLILKSGEIIRLRHDLKLFREPSGRTFGLTGVNERGKRCQFVFHRGQFKADSDFQAAMTSLDRGPSGKA